MMYENPNMEIMLFEVDVIVSSVPGEINNGGQMGGGDSEDAGESGLF